MQKKKRMKSLLLRGIDRFAQANAVGVAETGGINTYAKHVCWRRRDMDNAIASHKSKGNPLADSLCTVIFF